MVGWGGMGWGGVGTLQGQGQGMVGYVFFFFVGWVVLV